MQYASAHVYVYVNEHKHARTSNGYSLHCRLNAYPGSVVTLTYMLPNYLIQLALRGWTKKIFQKYVNEKLSIIDHLPKALSPVFRIQPWNLSVFTWIILYEWKKRKKKIRKFQRKKSQKKLLSLCSARNTEMKKKKIFNEKQKKKNVNK